MNEDKNILVVDDNQENLRVVSSHLKEEGYKIALALNGKDAIIILNDNNIDLILLDIMMPEMDGLETCRRIKEVEKLKEIPIIFLTAKNQIEDIVEGFRAGGVDYLTKPFNKDELLIRVKTHIDLAGAKQKIIEMNQARDKLYSIIAHDIRSPFSAIIQTINAISEGFLDVNSEEFRNIMKHLEQRTNETRILLNNLLEWTKMQGSSISLSFREIPVYALLSECIQLLKGNADNKNILIQLDVPEDSIAFFDEVSIHTVFRNLISNAIKFTPEKGQILISYKTINNHAEISVKDNGKGMSDEIIEKIFNKDEHYTSTGTNKEQGTGLGLYIVKDFVKKNNGKLDVKSNSQVGTEITVFLPLTKNHSKNDKRKK